MITGIKSYSNTSFGNEIRPKWPGRKTADNAQEVKKSDEQKPGDCSFFSHAKIADNSKSASLPLEHYSYRLEGGSLILTTKKTATSRVEDLLNSDSLRISKDINDGDTVYKMLGSEKLFGDYLSQFESIIKRCEKNGFILELKPIMRKEAGTNTPVIHASLFDKESKSEFDKTSLFSKILGPKNATHIEKGILSESLQEASKKLDDAISSTHAVLQKQEAARARMARTIILD